MTATSSVDNRSSESGALPGRRTLSPGDRILIAGAGPAGLTAGYLLAKQGYSVTVVEADSVVGGISRTARYKDFRFDIGGHRFFTKITPVQKLWEELLGDQFIEVPRLSRILYNGKFFNYPLKAANALAGLGIYQAVMIVLSYAKARLRPNPIEENFEQWVSNRFGSRLYRIFFKTYTEKVWGIPCTEVRAEWAAQRVQGLSLMRAILSATSLQRRDVVIKSLIESFRYPRLGPGQMWEKCAGEIERLGGRVLMGHSLRKFEVSRGRVERAIVEASGESSTISAEHFITTIPLRSLVRSIQPPAPASVERAAESLAYRDFILVALIVDQSDVFPDNWIYVHTPGVLVGRIQNFNNWSKAMVPRAGVTCIGMEYFCFRGDGLWNRTDADLVELATRELASLNLAPGATVIDGSVIRMPKAYPIYDSTYKANVDEIRAHLSGIGNLITVGRNGMHKYNNQDHSMYTAMLAVENMNGSDHDLWAVNTDLEYHEEQRIEDEPSRGSGVTT